MGMLSDFHHIFKMSLRKIEFQLLKIDDLEICKQFLSMVGYLEQGKIRALVGFFIRQLT